MVVELFLSRSNATAKYYGINDVRTRNTQEELLATFTVMDKANKLTRPVAGGTIKGGALRSQVLGY
jgi:alkaline phosphatase D